MMFRAILMSFFLTLPAFALPVIMVDEGMNIVSPKSIDFNTLKYTVTCQDPSNCDSAKIEFEFDYALPSSKGTFLGIFNPTNNTWHGAEVMPSSYFVTENLPQDKYEFISLIGMSFNGFGAAVVTTKKAKQLLTTGVFVEGDSSEFSIDGVKFKLTLTNGKFELVKI